MIMRFFRSFLPFSGLSDPFGGYTPYFYCRRYFLAYSLDFPDTWSRLIRWGLMIRYLMHDQLTIDERPAPRCLILVVNLIVVHTANGLTIIRV